MRRLALMFAAAVMLGGAGTTARAGVLLVLVDAPGQNGTPFSLQFTASTANTTIDFAGYQVPSSEVASLISLTVTGGGPELLGQDWIYTPAPIGAFAGQFDDGSGVNALTFLGTVAGSYDHFAQIIPTIIGQSYTLTFSYFNSDNNAPSSLVVSAIPEPSTLTMLGAGAAGLVLGFRRRLCALIA